MQKSQSLEWIGDLVLLHPFRQQNFIVSGQWEGDYGELCAVKPGPDMNKTFFMLSSVEHEIVNAHKYKNIKNFSIF